MSDESKKRRPYGQQTETDKEGQREINRREENTDSPNEDDNDSK